MHAQVLIMFQFIFRLGFSETIRTYLYLKFAFVEEHYIPVLSFICAIEFQHWENGRVRLRCFSFPFNGAVFFYLDSFPLKLRCTYVVYIVLTVWWWDIHMPVSSVVRCVWPQVAMVSIVIPGGSAQDVDPPKEARDTIFKQSVDFEKKCSCHV